MERRSSALVQECGNRSNKNGQVELPIENQAASGSIVHFLCSSKESEPKERTPKSKRPAIITFRYPSLHSVRCRVRLSGVLFQTNRIHC